MLEDTIIEVALGLMFLYALLSLVTTSVTEGFANLFSTRARSLETWLEHMLGSANKQPGSEHDIAKDLLGHPMIQALAAKGKRPDYIPTKLFTKVLLEVLSHSDATRLAQRPDTYEELRAMVHAIEVSAPVRKVLLNLATNARRDLREAETNIEEWFDASMERLSSWYGRRSQVWAFVFASMLTVVGNADTLMIADAMWTDSDLRAAVARQAVGLSRERAEGDSSEQDAGSLAEGDAAPDIEGNIAPSVEVAEQTREITQEEIIEELEVLRAIDGFPFGWSTNPIDRRYPPTSLFGWLMKLIGFGITVLATTLGAPFWFGLLSRVINLRGSSKTSASNVAVEDALDGDPKRGVS